MGSVHLDVPQFNEHYSWNKVTPLLPHPDLAPKAVALQRENIFVSFPLLTALHTSSKEVRLPLPR